MVDSLIARLPEPMRTIVSFIKEVWQEFKNGNGMLTAAAVSFYVFLSIFPLLLVAVAVLGYLLGSPDNAQRVLSNATSWLAVGSESKDLIAKQLVNGRGAATGIGLFVLLWSGMAAFVVLEQALNVAWGVDRKRGYIKRRGVAVVLLLIVAVLLLLSAGMTAGINAIRSGALGNFVSGIPLIWTVLGYAIPVIISIAMFTIIYSLLPYTHVPWKTALTGGIFSGVLWELAKLAFTYYVVHFAKYNKVYGSLGSVILLLVWINYSAIITLLGAELATVWQHHRDRRQ